MKNIISNLSVNEIASFIGILSALFLVIRYLKIRSKNNKNHKDISDFITEEKVKHYKSKFVRTQCVDRPPDIEDEPKESYEHANRQDLIQFFIKQAFTSSSKKIYLILGGAGMGKTTFLVNLFLEYNSKRIGKGYRIKFVSLSNPHSDEYIEKYKKDDSQYKDGSNTILLLDAFDEDPNALENYDARLSQIILLTKNYRKVIITSRTHFFPEESKEKFSSRFPIDGEKDGYRTFIKKYIAPFSDEEITKYLRKNYGYKVRILDKYFYINPKREKIEKIVNIATNLVVRPMLLEQIELLLESNQIFSKEHQVYSALIDEWIKRESKKQPNNTSDDFFSEMKEFLEIAAIHIYKNFYSHKGLFIDLDLLESLAMQKEINLNKIDLTARSLLNRNPNGQYKFSHKSILEAILAKIDAGTFDTSKFIDFETFDFGLLIRNQMLVEKLTTNNKQIFVESSRNSFQPLNIQKQNLFDKVTCVFATGVNEIEIRKFRIFKNLKTIYYFPGFYQDNIGVIKISNHSSVGPQGLTKKIYFYGTNNRTLVTMIIPFKDEPYFNKNKIIVYKVTKSKQDEN
ncbi:MAG: hypothetical protein GQ574_08360 [Crocinitomix sp.]|nr:hypothetical protein [Crocinitomix sp.]